MPLACLSKNGLESGSMIREHLLVYVNVDWLSYKNDVVYRRGGFFSSLPPISRKSLTLRSSSDKPNLIPYFHLEADDCSKLSYFIQSDYLFRARN